MNAPERHERHYKELEALGASSGADAYAQLVKIEAYAHHWTTQAANVYIEPEALEKRWASITARVRAVFGGTLPPGFKINKDPRGAALKIEQPEDKRLISYVDWGGYGILAPELDE